MAKIVGVWMYVAPRKPSDDVTLTGAYTLILTEEEKRKIGDNLLIEQFRVMDDDTFSDDEVYKPQFPFQIGPANVNAGPNTYPLQVTLPRSKVVNSEPSYELYFRVRLSGGGVTTNWANSQTERVRYK